MTSQVLDSMDLEREKGITIKARAVRLEYTAHDGLIYGLNLIDTPGPRRLRVRGQPQPAGVRGRDPRRRRRAGHRGPDAGQRPPRAARGPDDHPGHQQDRPAVRPARRRHRGARERPRDPARGGDPRVAPRRGPASPEILEAIVARDPAAQGRPERAAAGPRLRLPLRPLQGRRLLRPAGRRARSTTHDVIRLMASGAEAELLELGVFRPQLVPVKQPGGRRGRLRRDGPQERPRGPGRRHRHDRREAARPEPLPGYQEAKSLVFAGLYPLSGPDYPLLRDALEKLHLNDASFTYEPESSVALGLRVPVRVPGPAPHGDRPGAPRARVQPRPHRVSAPSVEYRVHADDEPRRRSHVDNPAKFPDVGEIETIEEPWVKLGIVTPDRYIGSLMELTTGRRGSFENMEYLDPQRVHMHFELPLAELIVDYYDQLKSRTQGYASMDYEEIGYRPANLVKLDVLVNGEPVDALSLIVHRDRAQTTGRQLVDEAPPAHPAPDVRGAGPGGDRQPRRRPRDHPGHAQERAGEVLRWRHHPQAQAAREAEGRASSG